MYSNAVKHCQHSTKKQKQKKPHTKKKKNPITNKNWNKVNVIVHQTGPQFISSSWCNLIPVSSFIFYSSTSFLNWNSLSFLQLMDSILQGLANIQTEANLSRASWQQNNNLPVVADTLKSPVPNHNKLYPPIFLSILGAKWPERLKFQWLEIWIA